MPIHVSFEYLRDKRANLFFAGLAIPDVSGICLATVKFLVFSGWFVGSSNVGREFRRSGVPGMGREFRRLALQLTWRVHCPGHTGRVWYSYRTCPVWTTRVQRLVFKCLEGREFRRSEVPTFFGSSDASQHHCNLVTIGAVWVIPDVRYAYRTCPVLQRL